MNASIRGTMFVKADRINGRIKTASQKLVLNRQLPHSPIDYDDFEDFLKVIEVIINDELTEKGIERKWNKSYTKPESLNNAYSQGTTKKRMSWLKTLMMKLHIWK